MEDAVFAVAMIGNQVPQQGGGSSPPVGTSAPPLGTPETTASLDITALSCPTGYGGDDFRTDCPEPLEGITFYLQTEGSSDSIEAISDANGATAYEDLAAGTACLSSAINANAGTIVPRCTDGYPYTLDLVAGSAVGCDWFMIPRERTDGTIRATLATCPYGMTAESFDPAACAVTSSDELHGLDLLLTSEDGSVQLSLGDAEPAGPSQILSWDGLPVGLYALDVTALPTGFDSYWLQLDGGPACEVPAAACSALIKEDAGGADFVIYFFPAATVEPTVPTDPVDIDGDGFSDRTRPLSTPTRLTPTRTVTALPTAMKQAPTRRARSTPTPTTTVSAISKSSELTVPSPLPRTAISTV